MKYVRRRYNKGLTEDLRKDDDWYDNEAKLLDTICGGVLKANEKNQKFCAFVDGLDEYVGDVKSVVSRLLGLQHRTGMKMCFASRPEPVISRMLGSATKLFMQHHNQNTIHDYIESACSFLQPDEQAILRPLCENVENEASGVILWARFMIDELTTSCILGATAKELDDLRQTYPKELGLVYDRILGRLSEKQRIHAAIAFYILDQGHQTFGSEGDFPSYVFFITWSMMVETIDTSIHFDSSFDLHHFQLRMHAMLGALLEFSDAHKTVRHVHKTLVSYLRQSDDMNLLIVERVNSQFREDFAGEMYALILRKAAAKIPYDALKLFRHIWRHDKHGMLQEPRTFAMDLFPPATARWTLVAAAAISASGT